ncbi:MAG TPA: alpha/beta hydrolase [candidate division Zixibacteria bacterium]|nr:alpha/beta hydrolase [candidate division Zixibacteria bacterium]
MSKLFRMLWVLILAVVIFYSIVCVYIYISQDKMIYYPTDDVALTPEQVNLEYEEIFVKAGQLDSVCAWFFPKDINYLTNKVILFADGNAGNMSYRLESIIFMNKLGANVLMFDYRGYWKSSGKPSETATYEDARACYDWLIQVKGFKPENIVIFGRSLGGAVAIDLATKVKCGGLIVESSFTSAPEMAAHVFPFFPVRSLSKYKYDSIKKIKNVNCPVLVTHSPDDEIIPFKMGQILFDEAKEPKTFVQISGGHNDRDYLQDSTYRSAVSALLK